MEANNTGLKGRRRQGSRAPANGTTAAPAPSERLQNLGQRLRYGAPNGLLGRYFLTHCFGGAEVAIPG